MDAPRAVSTGESGLQQSPIIHNTCCVRGAGAHLRSGWLHQRSEAARLLHQFPRIRLHHVSLRFSSEGVTSTRRAGNNYTFPLPSISEKSANIFFSPQTESLQPAGFKAFKRVGSFSAAIIAHAGKWQVQLCRLWMGCTVLHCKHLFSGVGGWKSELEVTENGE